MDDYVTVAQAAELLGMSPVGVRTRLERGLMRGRKVHPRLWLIPTSEVERWQAIGRVQGKRRHQQPARALDDAAP
jgi:excisionase family DNA binding protein